MALSYDKFRGWTTEELLEYNFDLDFPEIKKFFENIINDSSNKNTFIYFVRVVNSNMVKIGKSKNPLKRLSQLQTRTHELIYIDVMISLNDKYEKIIHKYFEEEHVNNEWFFLSDRLNDFIDRIWEKQK